MRPPVELANSWLSQDAKNGLLSDPADYLKAYYTPLSAAPERWNSVADASHWRALSQVGDVISDVCAVLGVDPADFQDVPRENNSVSKEALELLLDLKLPFRVNEQNNFNKQLYLDEMPRTGAFKMSKDDARDVQARHDRQIARFCDLVPDVPAACLQLDFEEYPDAFSLRSDPPNYLNELRFAIERLNAQLWLERCVGSMNLALAMFQSKDLARASDALDRAEMQLSRAMQVNFERVSEGVETRRQRLDRMKLRLRRMSARQEAGARASGGSEQG